MDGEHILDTLRSLDVNLRVEGGRLLVNAPPGVLTPELQADISRHREEIVEFLRLHDAQRESAPLLGPVPRDGSLPLSSGQQRFWFLQHLEPETAAYNIPAVISHQGPLDVGVVERCLAEIVRRHEILRTFFPSVDGLPTLAVAAPSPMTLPVVSLEHLPEAERADEAARLLQAEARIPFDIEKGPVWRASLLRLGPESHRFLLTVHHIACDWWSLGLFFREFAALERAFSYGLPSPLPELPIQYADYAHWQQRCLQTAEASAQLEYWREQLSGTLPALNLPTDRPRPALQSYRSRGMAMKFSRELSQALESLSQQEGATLFITLVAALAALFHRYSGQSDILLGTPIASRGQAMTEGLIGFFINTLVLRCDVSGNPSFRELLRRTKEMALGAYAHQDIPFEKLVEELHPERDLSRSPLFQVMFVLHNVPKSVDLSTTGNLSFTASGSALFDLSIELRQTVDGIVGGLDYNVDLFDERTVERMVSHLRVMLEAIVAQPDRQIAEMELMGEEERGVMLERFAGREERVSAKGTVLEEIEGQVERRGGMVAVECEGRTMSYQELGESAGALAERLARAGVGRGSVVAVYLERSVEVVAVLIGIWKAGGVYVPLETEAPGERLAYILEETGCTAIVTSRGMEGRLPGHGARVVLVDEPGGGGDGKRLGCARREDLAYVIYTSGSTGKPKGVMVSHGALAGHVAGICREFGLVGEDRVLQFSSLSFDASLEQLLPALTVGARVVLRGKDVWSPREFGSRVKGGGLTVVDLPTAYWHEVAQEWAGAGKGEDGLRLVVVGGETMLPESVKAWRRTPWGGVRLVNAYGPTEGTITSTVWDVNGDDERWRIPIGRPLKGKEIYILDGHGQSVPIGVVGELYLGGMGLAEGYWRQAGLTAERFVADAWSGRSGDRMYRTGDLGRFLADGSIEFVGRADEQVKVRGFRVELAEIETVLAGHAGVKQAVVLAREMDGGGKVLVAFVAREAGGPDVEELRRYLKGKVTEYMVPARWVVVMSVPRMPTGKVDRKALARLDVAGGTETGEVVAPRNSLELRLTKIWEQVLRRSPIGVTENFFDAGGHSLLAMQVISRVQKELGMVMPVRAVFDAPTIDAFAGEIRKLMGAAPQRPALPLIKYPRTDAPVLSFGQQRLWFLHLLERDSSAFNIPAFIRHRGSLDVAVIERCLTEIVRRHEIFRTRIAVLDGQPHQVIDPPEPVALPVVDLQHLPETERASVAAQLSQAEAEMPYDLEKGPLWRVKLLRLGPLSHVFLVTMHHVISDAWSMGVFFKELEILQSDFSNGRPSSLRELPVQYSDYARWQREWLQGPVLDAQLHYWKNQLGGELPVLELPTDRPRPALQTYRSNWKRFVIDPRLKTALRELGQQEGATLFMTGLAALNLLFHRYSGQSDILIGTPISNRNHLATEGLIGFFVNTLIFRTNLSGNPTFRELLAQVRRVALDAYAYQDMPFDRLIDELQPERNLSRPPLVQVLFNVQTAPRAVDVSRMSTVGFSSTGTTAYDFCLELIDAGDGMVGGVDYNVDLFDERTVERMVDHFRVMLEEIVAQPDRRIAEMELMGEEERGVMLERFAGREERVSAKGTVLEEIEGQVERRGGMVAVECEGRTMSYQELGERAGALAERLARAGVGRGSVVAVYLERSVEVVAVLIGIWKAGGVYVPLETEAPGERLAYILEETGCTAIVTSRGMEGRLPGHGARVVLVDEPGGGGDGKRSGCASREDLAYVIYTSGSTGKPKGVMVSHGALAGHVAGICREFGLVGEDRVLQFSSLSFDASLEQLLPALTVGARVVLRGKDVWSPREFGSRVKGGGLTVVDLPTAYWHEVAQEWAGAGKGEDGLRLVVVGGETMLPESVKAWRRTPWGGVRLVNAYGPTEGTITSTVHDVSGDGQDWRIPIGRPLKGKEVYILDGYGHCAPIGVIGGLYLGGMGLAEGYWRQAGLTAERFVADGWSSRAGERMYRTGDLGRYLADGSIEFVGREDEQVKVRGFRVELAEIETVLAGLAGVKQVVVLAREMEGGGKVLVAFVVRVAGAPDVEEMRRYLKGKVPEYMVPGRWVLVEAVPRTPTGKVDQKALARLDESSGAVTGELVAPRDPLELQLTKIWEQVLRRSPVGVTENFFDAGGHSLLAVRLFARIEKVLGKRLPLVTLYQDATIERQAAIIRNEGWQAPWDSLVAIQPGGARPPFFIVHGVGGNILWCRDLVRRLGADLPCYGLQAQGLNPDRPAHNRVEEMAAHYIKDIRNLQPEGPYYLGGFCMGGMVAFEIARQLEAAGERVGMVALLEAHGPDYFLDPERDIQYFYEERTLFQRVMINIGKLRSLPGPKQGALLRAKILMVRERLGIALGGLVTVLLIRLGHRTLGALHHVHQSNIDAQIHYKPRGLLSGRVDLFQCEKQPVGDYQFDALFGWGPFVGQPIHVHTVPGWHSTLLQEPYVSSFAQVLNQALREAHAQPPETIETA